MYRSRKIAALAGVIGAAGAAALSAGPALASAGTDLSAATAVPGSQLSSLTADGSAQAPNRTSSGFAGWVFAPPTSHETAVSVIYQEPRLTCTSATQGVAATAYILTGSSSSMIVQAAGTLAVCVSGHAAYIPYLVANSQEQNFTSSPVTAGDLVKVTVVVGHTSSGAKAALVSFSDLTHRFSKSAVMNLAAGDLGALAEDLGETKVYYQGNPIGVVNFRAIQWGNGTIGGQALGSIPQRAAIDMSTGRVLNIATGALQGNPGSGFVSSFKHS